MLKYPTRHGYTDPSFSQYLPMLSPLLQADAREQIQSRKTILKMTKANDSVKESQYRDPLLAMSRYDFLHIGAPRGSNTNLMGPGLALPRAGGSRAFYCPVDPVKS